ncbi:hypothetical protein N802_05770 [Knoellia sinensis KCTC 19936]|uniref:Anibiotic ABC transporter n=1 Tax=Knoellia sinensis KCTC 19936 TaxID=1385520 RepID=A0A0A0J2J4_9MICO|nr:hypothetical protein [Knoellia sinensis]KGN30904.1 hypothetical protein N802_05770 [Knoellia sinensis KCTC 19936]
MSSPVVGTHHLVRLILRRDRIRLPLWILGTTTLVAGSAQSVLALYDTPEKRAGYAATVEASGAGKLMNGIPYDVDRTAGIVAYETTSTATVLVALMVVFLVVRHTRAEEESGRAELLRATVTGRHAATAAAVLVAAVASVLVGMLDALALGGLGLPWAGSFAHGISLTGIGLVFTALAAAVAQVTASARLALGISGAVLGFAFLVRGVGAVGDSVLARLSPFGWTQELRPFGEVAWVWLAPLLLAAVAGLALTAYLTVHRDAGAGLIQPRPGNSHASASLGTPVGLALRLQRGLWIGWATGLVITAALFGSLGKEVRSLLADNPEMADLIAVGEGDVLEGFFAYSALLLVAVATAFSVSAVLRLRAEEEAGRAELVLSTALPRTRWLVGSLAVTLVATIVNVTLIGVAMATAHGVVGDDWGSFGSIAGAAVELLPATLVVLGAAVLLLGWLPRWAGLAWAVFAFALIEAYLGDLLRFPDWLSALSPFSHVPQSPVEAFTSAPGIVALAVAFVAIGVGAVGVRLRDIG